MQKMKLLNPVIRAKDRVEGLSLLRSEVINEPLMILLDLNMPRMGGLEFLKELRADEQLRDAVGFILTTSNNDEEIVAAYRNNIAGYIVKSSLSQDFKQLLVFLDHYWRLVEPP